MWLKCVNLIIGPEIIDNFSKQYIMNYGCKTIGKYNKK